MNFKCSIVRWACDARARTHTHTVFSESNSMTRICGKLGKLNTQLRSRCVIFRSVFISSSRTSLWRSNKARTKYHISWSKCLIYPTFLIFLSSELSVWFTQLSTYFYHIYSRKWSSALSYICVVAVEKGPFGLLSTKVANLYIIKFWLL